MWEIILIIVCVVMLPPVNVVMEKLQLHRYEHTILKILGKGVILSITVLICTFVITQIRDKKEGITTDIMDKGMVEFTATAPHITSTKAYNGKRMTTITNYYVKYVGKMENLKLTYYEKVSSTEEMENLVKQKASKSLRVFQGTDGEIYYGQESDTVQSYLADNVAWKPVYHKIIVIAAATLILLEILLISLGIKMEK